MPLINSVVKTVLKQQLRRKLLVEESDGTQYEYNPGPDHVFVEGETLEIRVDGLEKNLELGGLDTLKGVVVNSEIVPENSVKTPFKIVETGEWNPVELYGDAATEALYPYHSDQNYRELRLGAPEMPDDAYRQSHDRVGELFKERKLDEAILELSSILSRYPWMLDCYHVLGNVSMEHQRYDEAEKYFTMGIKIAEMSLPDDDSPYVINGKYMENSFYLVLMQSMGDLSFLKDNRDEALEYYRKLRRIDPHDHTGTRFLMKEITGEDHPAADKDYPLSQIEPYVFAGKYNIPIRDTYDPMSRPNFEKWSQLSEFYRRLIIQRAHEDTLDVEEMSPEDIEFHCSVHLMAETSLANNIPKDARLMLARYMADGNDRHEAIHHLGRDLVQAFMARAQQQQAQQQAQTQEQAPEQNALPESPPE